MRITNEYKELIQQIMVNIFKIQLLVFLIFLNLDFIFPQVTQEWVVRYSRVTNSNDGATAIVADDSGNVYVTGASQGVGTGSDYATIKYSSNGFQQWVRIYNGPGNGQDIANAIIVDNDGNIYITGSSEGVSSGTDFATIKYSSLGDQLWVARYTSVGNNLDAGYKIAFDNSNNIYVTGESNGDYATIKYNSSGNEQWIRRYSNGIAYSITVDDSSNVYVTGRGSGDCVTIKYDSSGFQKWISRYNGQANGDDFALSIGIDSLGNIYVAGSSVEYSILYGGYLTIKYNPAGIQQWVRVYEGSGNFLDVARAIRVDKSGNAYVTGYSTESGQGYNFTTIKYSTNGDTLWKATYNNGPNDIAFAIAIDKFGNAYVTGESDGGGTGDDFATVKYNSLGQQQWVKRYDYSGQYGDSPQAITIDNNGNLYVTGSSNRDYLTIKYSQLTGVNNNMLIITNEYKLEQNYPNPFNPKTIINYQCPMFNHISLNVFDVLGNEVATLVNEKQNTGSYSVEFNGTNFPSGIYFYRLEATGHLIEIKRMILLK